jgi:hypothetical protein
MAHVSIGSKQPKKEEDHDAVPVGFVMPEGSLAVAEARATQPSRSRCISDLGAVVMVTDCLVRKVDGVGRRSVSLAGSDCVEGKTDIRW